MSTTNTPAFEIVTSPAVVETASVFGLHYAKGMLSREVARGFRAAFGRAQEFGAFKGVKLSVTSERGAVRVEILAAPFAANDPRKLEHNIRGGLARARVATSDRMSLLVAQIEMIGGMFRRDNSDLAADYHDTNAFFFVSVVCDDTGEHTAAHARVAGASLRFAVAAVDALSPLADDRPALAVECLARGEFAEAAELAAGVLDAGAHDPVSSCLARAIVATLTRIAGSPRDLENAASAAAVDVRKAVEAAGRTADEGRGVFAAAMVA